MCPELVSKGRCEKHRLQHRKRQDETRQSSNARGYTSRWRAARKGYLSKHPLCVHCEAKGIVKAANVVDHIVPHKGDMKRFWDRTNWQPLCTQHHNIKTATEDGGFGRHD